MKVQHAVLQQWEQAWHNIEKLSRGGSETTPPNPLRFPMPNVRRSYANKNYAVPISKLRRGIRFPSNVSYEFMVALRRLRYHM